MPPTSRRRRWPPGAATPEALAALALGHGATAEETRRSLIAKIGEKIDIRRAGRLEAPDRIGAYVHGTRIGVLVGIKGGDDALARDIAMHVAAVNPQYVSPADVPADVVAKEREILAAQAAAEGKPAAIVEKMVEGRLRKYLAEICLTGQPFVKDPDTSVGALLEKSKAAVSGFLRFEVGEGIEKKQENFAAEVMAQVEAAERAGPELIRMRSAKGSGMADTQPRQPLKRILLKISGEALLGVADYGIDPAILKRIASEIREVMTRDIQVAVVIGGGNIFRGAGLARAGMDRVTADHMGMLATVMNGLALQDALESLGSYARVMSAVRVQEVCEDYIRRRAVRHLEKGPLRDLRGRHRQPVLHHRHRRFAARDRDRCRPASQGDQGQRHLRRRPGPQPEGEALPDAVVRQGARRQAGRDGRDGHRACAATTRCRCACST